ncbi:MAG: ATP-grasp domain-containing protein [Spirochaetia bacterium]
MAGLPGVAHAFLRSRQLTHPSAPPFRLIVDRVSFCDPFLRHLVRYWSLAGAYVLNDPFFTLVFDKLSECLLYDAHAIAHPRTILLPSRNGTEDVTGIVEEPDWRAVEETVGFPCILKPVDGYAWQDVFRVPDSATLRGLYESFKSRRTMIVQELIRYVGYYRAFCVSARDVLIVRWSPRPFDLGEYAIPRPGELGSAAEEHIVRKTIDLNAAFGLDFNTVEWCVTSEGTPVIIDSYNDVPDVRREKLPPEAYDWVVDRFCACVKDKLAGGGTNRIMSRARPGAGPISHPGAPAG